MQEEKIELKDGKEGYGLDAGYSMDHTAPQATTRLDGGDEETMYDVAPAVAGSSSNGASAQPTNPFTRQQYQQVPTNSTNPFAKM